MKENDDDDIEKLFENRFSDDEAPISPRVWANIKNTLPPDNSGAGNWYAKRYFLFTAVGTIIIGGVLALFYFRDTIVDNNNSLTENSSITKEQKTEIQNNSTKDNKSLTKENDINYSTDGDLSKNEIKGKLDVSENNTSSNKNSDNSTSSNNTSSNNTSSDKNLNNTTSSNTTSSDKNSNNSTSSNTTSSDKNSNNTTSSNTTSSDKNSSNSISSNTTSSDKNSNNSTSWNNTSLDKNLSNSTSSNTTSSDKNSNNTTSSNTTSSDKNSSNSTSSNTTSSDKNSSNSTSSNTTSSDKNSSNSTSSNNTSLDKNSSNSTSSNNTLSDKNSINNTSSDKNSSNSNLLNNSSYDKNSSNNTFVNSNSKDSSIANQNLTNPAPKLGNVTIQDSASAKDSILLSTNKDTSYAIANTKPVVTDSTKNVVPDSSLSKEKNKKDFASRISLDFVIGPAVTGAYTKATDSQYQAVEDSKNNQDHSTLNFSAGVGVNYNLHPRWYISTGLLYSGYTEKYKFKNDLSYDETKTYTKLVDSTSFVDSMGFPIPDSVYQVTKDSNVTNHIDRKYASKKTDQYSIVSIPVSISYYILKRERLNISVTTGVRINLLLNGVTYVMNEDKTDLVGVRSGFNKLTLSYMASFGMEYKLREKLYLLAQPVANFNLSSVHSKSFYLSQKPYSIGLNIGLKVKF